MSVGNYYGMNGMNGTVFQKKKSSDNNGAGIEIIKKPIDMVDNTINKTVDTFIKPDEDEKKRKSNKKAIYAGSTVLVLSGLVMLLNPKSSGKIIGKLKQWSQTAENKAKNNKSFVGKIYSSGQKFLNKCAGLLEFSNNINSFKDYAFQNICTAEKTFSKVKNETARKALTVTDKGVRKVLNKPHKVITQWFDRISKSTVHGKYKKAGKKMDFIDEMLKNYGDKLSASQKKELELKLNEIRKMREYFNEQNISLRLENQEKLMDGLEKDFSEKLKSYVKGFRDKNTNKTKHFNDNIYFWAQEMLMPERKKLEKSGADAVAKLMGDGKSQKGLYNEILEILSPTLKDEERSAIESGIKKASKRLFKANKSECTEYFDKKRDLMLGSAPTDVLTAILTLGACGVAMGVADNKEDKISRALTLGFPAIAGVGASIAMTAMLFSGVQGMIYGTLISAGLSKAGSELDKLVTPKHIDDTNIKPQEVFYA